jgi:bifunctional non-homologous end joining protein LigD
MSLTKYKQKRRFDKTPEPAGELRNSKTKVLEFVVQKHHASHLHYDFRLEMDGVLKSWAVPKGPSLRPQDKRLAMMVEDHPYEYRKFEGSIPKGNYGAGNVIIWDHGTYEPRQPSSDPEKALLEQLKKGHITFIMHGQKLNGEFALIRTPYRGDNTWLLVKKDDDFAADTDISEKGESVISGKQVDQLPADKIDLSATPKSDFPAKVKPMLATLASEPFDSDDWLFEIKWDGYRAIACWDGKVEQLYSRNGNKFTAYKTINESLRELKHSVVIDGEIVALDQQGKANFGWLQNYSKRPQGQLVYYVFDILWCDGHDLTDLPLIERKQILKKILPESSAIRYSDHIVKTGKAFFLIASSKELEGIMAKNSSSRYLPGLRSRQWLKVKTHQRQEAVIGGYTEPRGSRKHIGALILGVYDGDKLKYIGHTGGGIAPKLMPELKQKLDELEIKDSPFADKVKPNAPAHWVDPQLICEIEFSEWTSDGHMRQPIFVGLRQDKETKQVSREQPIDPKNAIKDKPPSQNSRLEFTHRDKVFFPTSGYSKGDLIDYYQSVAETMLPYIKDRPHSLLRQPNGAEGKSFFQKDVGHMPPGWVKTKAIFSESNDKDINYLVADSPDSLLYMVQLGCIEINPWNSRIKSLDKPDWCVIDLDPEDIDFREVIKAAKVVHDVCEELNIASYPKTSGKTGIHIFIPLQAKYSYDQSRQFGQLLATIINQRLPKTTSLERSPKKRQQKIYVDYLQNRAGQTLAAPYSVRPTPAANVSTPLDWGEVDSKLKPENFTISNTAQRLSSVGDIWKPVIGKGIDIESILKNLA